MAAWTTPTPRPASALRLIALDAPGGQGRQRLAPARRRPGASSACCSTRTPSFAEGCAEALLAALRDDPGAAVAGAQLLAPDGSLRPAPGGFRGWARRSPRPLFLHQRLVTQSGRGPEVREVGWVQSAAMLVRRADAGAGSATSIPPSSSTPTRPTSASACTTPAGASCTSPKRSAVHHEQLTTDRSAERRVVEFHRNRDLYMRKHHGPPAALAVRVLTAWTYAARSLAAIVLPGHDCGLVLAARAQGAAAGRRGPARGSRRLQRGPRRCCIHRESQLSSAEVAAVFELERMTHKAAADRFERTASGFVSAAPSLPNVWDASIVQIEPDREPPTLDELLELAELPSQWYPELAYRTIFLGGLEQGREIAMSLARRDGRSPSSGCWRSARRRASAARGTQPIDGNAMRRLKGRLGVEQGLPPRATAQFDRYDALRERVASRAAFTALDAGGKPAAIADSYLRGDIAVIEDVATLRRHRRQGLAGAAVMAATVATRSGSAPGRLPVRRPRDRPALLRAGSASRRSAAPGTASWRRPARPPTRRELALVAAAVACRDRPARRSRAAGWRLRPSASSGSASTRRCSRSSRSDPSGDRRRAAAAPTIRLSLGPA